MNSEELEQSLRTEFESYLNNVRAEMRQEVYDFQEKFQTEFEKHKSHLDEIFRDFSSRLENEKPIDEPFKESVVEHLRLARDEGARITASAIADAEEMQRETAAAEAIDPATSPEAGVDVPTIRIHPRRIISFGVDDPDVEPHRLVVSRRNVT